MANIYMLLWNRGESPADIRLYLGRDDYLYSDVHGCTQVLLPIKTHHDVFGHFERVQGVIKYLKQMNMWRDNFVEQLRLAGFEREANQEAERIKNSGD